MNNPAVTTLTISLPAWVKSAVDWNKTYSTDNEKMALAISLAQLNIDNHTGGPFGAAIFNRTNGQLVSVGVNGVLAANNSVLHAEVIAIMLAEKRMESFSLAGTDASHELFSSCEPCAMCLGASLWSGITRLVCAATGEDARDIGFDEGPAYEDSYRYLETKGISILRGFDRENAQAVLQNYARNGGAIYNGHNGYSGF